MSETEVFLLRLFLVFMTALSSLGVAGIVYLIKMIVSSDKRLAIIENIVFDLKQGRKDFYQEIRAIVKGVNNG